MSDSFDTWPPHDGEGHHPSTGPHRNVVAVEPPYSDRMRQVVEAGMHARLMSAQPVVLDDPGYRCPTCAIRGVLSCCPPHEATQHILCVSSLNCVTAVGWEGVYSHPTAVTVQVCGPEVMESPERLLAAMRSVAGGDVRLLWKRYVVGQQAVLMHGVHALAATLTPDVMTASWTPAGEGPQLPDPGPVPDYPPEV